MRIISRSAAVCAGAMVLAASLFAQDTAGSEQAAPHTVLLWPAGAPGAQGAEDADKPSLTIALPAGTNRVATGVVICPGGSYHGLAMDHEGRQVADWLNRLGIAAFILKYRLGPKYHHPIELWDAQRAIRYVRAHATEFGIRADHVGIWGFSAGGHLAATAGTHFDSGKTSAADSIDSQSSRPDFLILAYPVITMEDPYAHVLSRTDLLGEKPEAALIESLSNEKQVTAQTPPTFLFHTTEDQTVPVENSVFFYLACKKAGVPVEMHIYLKGKHGVGLAPNDPVLHTWTDRLADWLKVEGFR